MIMNYESSMVHGRSRRARSKVDDDTVRTVPVDDARSMRFLFTSSVTSVPSRDGRPHSFSNSSPHNKIIIIKSTRCIILLCSVYR